MRCALRSGMESVDLEVYDERNFTVDELIAWVRIPIPAEAIRNGEVKMREGRPGLLAPCETIPS